MKTLRNMIEETADYVKADLDDDEAAAVEARITSAINEANGILARRWLLPCEEDAVIAADGTLDTGALSQRFLALLGVSAGETELTAELHRGRISVDTPPGSTVRVSYRYIPADMVEDEDEFPYPDAVSWRLPCYYAAARYYEVKGTVTSLNKYRYWMDEFNRGMRELRGGTPMESRRIRGVYNLG